MRFASRPARLFRPAVIVPALAWAIVCAAAAWVAAGWYWRLAGPRGEQAVPAVSTDVPSVTREITSRNLFGLPVVAGEQTAAVSNSRYKLIGVAANTGSAPGFAIIQVDDKDSLAAIEGQEFDSGVKLVRVLPRSVEIERAGLRETLPLSEVGSTVPPPPVSPGAAPAQATPVPPPPPRGPAMIQRSAPPAEAGAEAPKESKSE